MLKKTVEELKRKRPREMERPEIRAEASVEIMPFNEGQLIALIDERIDQRA